MLLIYNITHQNNFNKFQGMCVYFFFSFWGVRIGDLKGPSLPKSMGKFTPKYPYKILSRRHPCKGILRYVSSLFNVS
jgi:hypothetical protein